MSDSRQNSPINLNDSIDLDMEEFTDSDEPEIPPATPVQHSTSDIAAASTVNKRQSEKSTPQDQPDDSSDDEGVEDPNPPQSPVTKKRKNASVAPDTPSKKPHRDIPSEVISPASTISSFNTLSIIRNLNSPPLTCKANLTNVIKTQSLSSCTDSTYIFKKNTIASLPTSVNDFMPRIKSSLSSSKTQKRLLDALSEENYTPLSNNEITIENIIRLPPPSSPLPNSSRREERYSFENWLNNCSKRPTNLNYYYIASKFDHHSEFYSSCTSHISHTHCIHILETKTALCCLCLTRPGVPQLFLNLQHEECAGNYIPGINCKSLLLNL